MPFICVFNGFLLRMLFFNMIKRLFLFAVFGGFFAGA